MPFVSVIVMMLRVPASGTAAIVSLVLYIPVLWCMLAQGAKRCHDRGNSGIWQIIPFYYLWMIFADGEIGDNGYGANPKHNTYDYFPEERGNGSQDSQSNDIDGGINIVDKKD